MKRKMIAVLLLVGVCLGVLVVEGVSQPPATPQGGFSAPPPPATATVNTTGGISARAPSPAPVTPMIEPQQQVWTFEQLVEALKAVRAQQKALQAQETDLLAKIAEKVEEKRKDLSKSEEVLQQLRGKTFIPTARRMDFDKDAPDRTHLRDKMDSKKK